MVVKEGEGRLKENGSVKLGRKSEEKKGVVVASETKRVD